MRSPGPWRDYVEPDLTHADAMREAEHAGSCRARSIIPDPLSVLIASESGRPILYPVFPLNAFKPERQCDHARRPIAKGSCACCMDCHDTGMRDHPAIRLKPADAIAPDPSPDEADGATPATRARPAIDKTLTRAQRRAIKFAYARTHADVDPSPAPGGAA